VAFTALSDTPQPGGDLLVRKPLEYAPQHLLLPFRQHLLKAGAFAPMDSVGHEVNDALVHPHLSARHQPDGLGQGDR